MADFELFCDGQKVAAVSGPRNDAIREIMHYMVQYANEGKVQVYEKKVSGKWVNVSDRPSASPSTQSPPPASACDPS